MSDTWQSREWHYTRNGKTYGPKSFSVIQSLIDNCIITPDTMVWNDGLPDWITAADAGMFGSPSTPTPTPTATATATAPTAPTPTHGHQIKWLTVPILISGIANSVGALVFMRISLLIASPFIALAIFEILHFTESKTKPVLVLARKARILGFCEVVAGMFNLVTLVCGIISVVQTQKVLQDHGSAFLRVKRGWWIAIACVALPLLAIYYSFGYINAECPHCEYGFHISEVHRRNQSQHTREYMCPRCQVTYPAAFLYKEPMTDRLIDAIGRW